MPSRMTSTPSWAALPPGSRAWAGDDMKALVFGVDPDSIPEVEQAGAEENPLLKGLAATPMNLIEVEDPKPIGPDWLVLRSRLTGICGSDSKQVFMENAEDEIDNAMTALIS